MKQGKSQEIGALKDINWARKENLVRRAAAIGLIVLSMFLLASCASSDTTETESSVDDVSQGLTADSGSEVDIELPDPAVGAALPEIELNRAALLTASEVDITYAQEYARNRAWASFKNLFPDLVTVIDRPMEIGEHVLWEDAIPSVNEMIEVDPKNPEYHLLSGFINFKLNYNNDAIAAFEKTIELDPKNFEAHFHLGVIYGIDEWPKSIDYLTQSIELATNPYQVSDAFARRALTYHKMERYDECFADIDRALSLAPNNGFALLTYGMIFKDKAERDREATEVESIPGEGFDLNP
jgi:tetratricopeptide (TPR) repeat protein